MKINEITDINQTYLTLSNIDIDFRPDIKQLITATDILLKIRHRTKLKDALADISATEERIKYVSSMSFPDETDPDIMEMKKISPALLHTLMQMRQKITAVL